MADLALGTFNVLNLHDAGAKVYGSVLYSSAAYTDKIAWLRARIEEMQADVIGFQEVWSSAALRDACGSSFEPEQVWLASSSDDGPAVGLASRLPSVGDVETITTFPPGLDLSSDGAQIRISRFQRPVLRATVRLPEGRAARVYVAHLKSKRPLVHGGEDFGDPRVKAVGYARSLLIRSAEAAALRWLVVEDMADTRLPVIVLGDLNDAEASVTTRIVEGDPPLGGSQATRRAAWDVLLYSAYALQAQRSLRDVAYSYVHDEQFEVLDHILVSEELSGLGPHQIAHFLRMHAWNDHLHDRPPITQSDHAPVVARFRMHAS